MRRSVVALLSVASFALSAADNGLGQTAARVDQLASQLAPSMRLESRVMAAEALKDHHPELAQKFVREVLDEVRSSDSVNPQLLIQLTRVAPQESVALLPQLKPGSERFVEMGLIQANRVRDAAALYRASWAKTPPRFESPQIFTALANESPEEAKKLFSDALAAFPFESPSPNDLFNLLRCAQGVSDFAPELAADVYDRVVTIAAAPDYGTNARGRRLAATVQVGAKTIVTQNSRDTLLVIAGARLHAIAPDRFEKHKNVLSAWDLNGKVTITRMEMGMPMDRGASPEDAIQARIGTLRSLSDAERPKAVLGIALSILTLPKGSKLGMAESLANLATEGDNGNEAMDAVAAALGAGIKEGEALPEAYIELAQLIRYEHARAPISDPALDAADALLTLRARAYQDNGFSLVSMDGKTYALDQLRGKIVLLNFWATWCPPCRKEMPDMETLYRKYGKNGLVVLAVSDEDRDTVAGFLEKNKYTFPILLDPGREVNQAFGVEGIPKSFIFDAQGKLVTLAIDMRTERQFLELLKEAGLQ